MLVDSRSRTQKQAYQLFIVVFASDMNCKYILGGGLGRRGAERRGAVAHKLSADESPSAAIFCFPLDWFPLRVFIFPQLYEETKTINHAEGEP